MERIGQWEQLWFSFFLNEFVSVSVVGPRPSKKILTLLLIIFIIAVVKGQPRIDPHFAKPCRNMELTI